MHVSFTMFQKNLFNKMQKESKDTPCLISYVTKVRVRFTPLTQCSTIAKQLCEQARTVWYCASVFPFVAIQKWDYWLDVEVINVTTWTIKTSHKGHTTLLKKERGIKPPPFCSGGLPLFLFHLPDLEWNGIWLLTTHNMIITLSRPLFPLGKICTTNTNTYMDCDLLLDTKFYDMLKC